MTFRAPTGRLAVSSAVATIGAVVEFKVPLKVRPEPLWITEICIVPAAALIAQICSMGKHRSERVDPKHEVHIPTDNATENHPNKPEHCRSPSKASNLELSSLRLHER